VSHPRSDDLPHLHATAILEVLNRHAVRYVVIGAFAAIAQQAPIAPTRDIDITPDDNTANLDKLSSALSELNARIRTTEPEGIPFDHDAASLRRADLWNLVCSYGEFNIAFQPAGIDGGYRELSVRSHRVRVEDVEVDVADLADVIRSKEAAGRPKDLRVLPALYRHQADAQPRHGRR
jgi:translation elongation factor EF-1beta